MKHDDLMRTFRERTAVPAPGSRARVWAALNDLQESERLPRRTHRGWVLAAASVAILVAVSWAVWGRSQTSALEWHDEQSVVVWHEAQASFEPERRHVEIKDGQVAVSAWGAPLTLSAAGHEVRVERGFAVVTVAAESVTADPIDGVIWFDGSSMQAPERAIGRALRLVASARALEPPGVRSARLVSRAEEAASEGNFEVAAQAFGEAAALDTLEAEIALYRKGEVELHQLQRPQEALDSFVQGEKRFRTGALRQERQLSAIESCVQLQRWSEVVDRTSTFLREFPKSERRDEVHALQVLGFREQGSIEQACAAAVGLPEKTQKSLGLNCQ